MSFIYDDSMPHARSHHHLHLDSTLGSNPFVWGVQLPKKGWEFGMILMSRFQIQVLDHFERMLHMTYLHPYSQEIGIVKNTVVRKLNFLKNKYF